MQERPNVFVLGGPNGAGKSTVADILIPESVRLGSYVNADVIAAELAPEDPGSVAVEAGRRMLRQIRRFRSDGLTFGFEATLASKGLAPFLRCARRSGFAIRLYFVTLPTPELTLGRVASRVAAGGHDVPETTVRRRYERSLANFFGLYRPLADTWEVWDNTGKGACRVACGTTKETTILDAVRWQILKSRVNRG